MNQQGTSFVSAQSATQVQTSPAPFRFISSVQFFSFAPTKDQISSHWMRLHGRLRNVLFWYSKQAFPKSQSSLSIVLRETPVIRAIKRPCIANYFSN